MKRLEGTIVPIVTPFTDDNQLDKGSLKKLCHTLIKKGVDGIFPCGTTGEMLSLDIQERKEIAEIVVSEASDSASVCVHTAAAGFKDTIELSQHALEIGADGIAIVVPYYYSYSQRKIFEYYQDIAEQLPTDALIYLYNIPGNSGNDILPETVKELVSLYPNFAGIKNTMIDLVRTMDYLKLGLKDFRVLIGCDQLVAPGLMVGCHGFVSSDSNVFPETFVKLKQLSKHGCWEEAIELQYKIRKMIEIMKNGASIPHIKMGLKLRGMIKDEIVRKPLKPIDSNDLQIIKEQLEII